MIKHLSLIKEQYDNSSRVNELLQMENGQFKDNQLDFQTILNDKIDQITKELKGEREKRLAEQNYARVKNILELSKITKDFFLLFFLIINLNKILNLSKLGIKIL